MIHGKGFFERNPDIRFVSMKDNRTYKPVTDTLSVFHLQAHEYCRTIGFSCGGYIGGYAFRHETAYRIFLRESDYDKKIHFNRVHYMDHCGAICL